MSRRAVILLVVLAVGCGREQETASTNTALRLPPHPTEVHQDIDPGNLLNVASGASVISRTAEATLEQSAAHAIDGLGVTAWWTPPGGGDHTLVFSLPAVSRIHRLGVTTTPSHPREIRFEGSLDGSAWNPIASMTPEASLDTQLIDIPPVSLRYLRVSTFNSTHYYYQLRAIHLIGEAAASPDVPSPDGCWVINGELASLAADGSRITGVTHGDRPTFIEGGFDGRVVRLMWSRGPMWGYAALTPGADGQTLSAVTFHEEIVVEYAGAAWFGKRVPSSPDCVSSGETTPRDEILARSGRWSMFGLRFTGDERLDPVESRSTLDALQDLLDRSPSQRYRIVAHEYSGGNPEENRRRAGARIEQLRFELRSRNRDLSRVEFVVAGSDEQAAPVTTAIQRLLASRIDLEVRR